MWVVVKEKEMRKRSGERKRFSLHVGVITVAVQDWMCWRRDRECLAEEMEKGAWFNPCLQERTCVLS